VLGRRALVVAATTVTPALAHPRHERAAVAGVEPNVHHALRLRNECRLDERSVVACLEGHLAAAAVIEVEAATRQTSSSCMGGRRPRRGCYLTAWSAGSLIAVPAPCNPVEDRGWHRHRGSGL
jgi:hypothetical protein